MLENKPVHIRLIGCGKMGSAMCLPLAYQNTLSFYDTHKEKSEELAKLYNGKSVASPLENGESVDLFLIAVKPQDLEALIPLLNDIPKNGILATVITGIPVKTYQHFFPHTPILRMMPNLAVKHGKGVVALVEDSQIDPYKEKLDSLLSPLGMLYWTQEDKCDMITSLTASGIAFIFSIVEAITDSGIAMGLPAKDAYPLTCKMIEGALACLATEEKVPADLKWEVTSPGGTTIAGIRAFEKTAVRSGLIETFLAAYQKAIDIGKIGQNQI